MSPISPIQTEGFPFSKLKSPGIIPISWGTLFLHSDGQSKCCVSLEYLRLDIVVHTFNSSTIEAETEGFL